MRFTHNTVCYFDEDKTNSNVNKVQKLENGNIMKCLIKISLTFLLLLTTTLVYADGIITNEDDVAVSGLRVIFGDVVNIISGEPLPDRPDSMLGHIFVYWNLLILTITSFVVGWVLLSMFFSSIHGDKQEENNKLILPVRVILAISLTIPLGAGFSGYQLMYLYAVGYSISVSNDMADIVYDGMNSGTIVTPGGGLNQNGIVASLYEMGVCMKGYNSITQSSDVQTQASDLLPDDSNDDTYEIEVVTGGGVLPWPLGSSIASDGCGKIKLDYSPPTSDHTDGEPEYRLLRDYYALLRTTHGLTFDLATTLTNRILVDEITGPDVTALIENQKQELLNIERDFEASRNQLYLTFLQESADAATNSTELLSAYGSLEPKRYGFIALGGTYWMHSLKTKALNASVTDLQIDIYRSFDEEIRTNEDLIELFEAAYQVNYEMGGMSMVAGLPDAEALGEQIDDDLSLVLSTSIATLEQGDDPLYAIMEMGHGLIWAAEAIFITQAAATVTLHTLDASKDATVSVLKIPIGIAKGLIASFIGFLSAIGIPMLLLGMLMAFWIPSLPLFHWIGGVIGAFIAIVEAMVLGPIHAMIHAVSGGKGIVAHRANLGYGIILGSLLRMPLLVIGFIAAISLILVAGKIVFLLWAPFASAMTSTSTTGLVSFFGLTAVLIAILNTVVERVFSFITDISDRGVKVLGFSPEGIGGLSESSGKSSFSESSRVVGEGSKGASEGMSKGFDDSKQDTDIGKTGKVNDSDVSG